MAQRRRARLGRPIKRGRFRKAPSQSAYFQVLSRPDLDAFTQTLSARLHEQKGSRPGASALDGKMIRQHFIGSRFTAA
jgi:hypothetical protein